MVLTAGFKIDHNAKAFRCRNGVHTSVCFSILDSGHALRGASMRKSRISLNSHIESQLPIDTRNERFYVPKHFRRAGPFLTSLSIVVRSIFAPKYSCGKRYGPVASSHGAFRQFHHRHHQTEAQRVETNSRNTENTALFNHIAILRRPEIIGWCQKNTFAYD